MPPAAAAAAAAARGRGGGPAPSGARTDGVALASLRADPGDQVLQPLVGLEGLVRQQAVVPQRDAHDADEDIVEHADAEAAPREGGGRAQRDEQVRAADRGAAHEARHAVLEHGRARGELAGRGRGRGGRLLGALLEHARARLARRACLAAAAGRARARRRARAPRPRAPPAPPPRPAGGRARRPPRGHVEQPARGEGAALGRGPHAAAGDARRSLLARLRGGGDARVRALQHRRVLGALQQVVGLAIAEVRALVPHFGGRAAAAAAARGGGSLQEGPAAAARSDLSAVSGARSWRG